MRLTSIQLFIKWGVISIIFLSPLIGYGILFPLGVILLFEKDLKIVSFSLTSIFLQGILYFFTIPVELGFFHFEIFSKYFSIFHLNQDYNLDLYLIISGILYLNIQKYYIKFKLFKQGNRKNNKKYRDLKINKIRYQFIILLFSYGLYLQLTTETRIIQNLFPFRLVTEGGFIFYYSIILLTQVYNKFSPPFFLNNLVFHTICLLRNSRKYFFLNEFKKNKEYKKLIKINFVFPGTGFVLVRNYSTGFFYLSAFLMVLLFFLISFSANVSSSLMIDFLSFFGLKPGISEKIFYNFFKQKSSLLLIFIILIFIIFISQLHFQKFSKNNSETQLEKKSFIFHIIYSFFFHLVVITLFLLNPVSLRLKNKSLPQEKESSNSEQKTIIQFQYPQKEDLSNEFIELNGSISAETKNENQNPSPESTGEEQLNVKNALGKNIPITYSNYISSKLRSNNSFYEYWEKAPKPYSSVISYVITQEGEIIDVEILEPSGHPDHDALTKELIYSMSPLMSYEKTKNDLQVIELFWNGGLNPDEMPTDLQKQLIYMYDGRVIFEVE